VEHTPAFAQRRRRVGLLASAALTAVVALVGAGCGDNSSSPPKTTSTTAAKAKAVAVTPDGLRQLAVKLDQPIYWVGAAADMSYRRTNEPNGRISVRYVPATAANATGTKFLTIGTYRLANAYAATQFAAGEPGAVPLEAPSGAIAFSTKKRPLNAWLAYAGSKYQIEVYDPKPGRARELVSSGKVVRVPGSPRETTRPAVVSAKQLASLASATHQIYWAGARPQRTYELTKTSTGGYLFRYLPKGAGVGELTPRLTIGSYPIKQPLAAVKRLGRAKGASMIKLPGGGIAALNPKFPKSVYLAFPGSNVEVEVFDPSLSQARQLVKSGQIAPVP
jgi:hypothetical protein